MEIVRVFFDDILMKNAPKLEGFKEVIERDYEARGIVLKYPNTLTFFGDSYKYLLDKFRQEGFCSTVEVELQSIKSSKANDVIRGIIFLADIIWNWDETTCEATLEDNSWTARILNNIDIKINVLTTRTKNDQDLNFASPITLLTYDPNDAQAVYSYSCVAYDVVDLFTVMIEFLSDNNMTFESTFLSNVDSIALTSGLSLRTGSEDTIIISLRQLLTSITRKYNLWFDVIEDGDGTFTFKLEEEDFFYGESETKFSYVKGITQKTFVDVLYSGVSIGCAGVKSLGGGTVTLDYYVLETHLEEEYYIYGECNINSIFDLRDEFIYDTNAIEDATVNGNIDYDTNIFLMEYNGINRANKYKYADDGASNAAPFYYNGNFLNRLVLGRYEFQSDLVQTFGNNDNSFEATLSTDSSVLNSSTSLTPLVFGNEVSDPNANYNPANGRYTAPGNGTYAFEVSIDLSMLSKTQPDDYIEIFLTFTQRDGATAIYNQTSTDTVRIYGIGEVANIGDRYVYTREQVAYLVSGNTMEVYLNIAVGKQSPTNTVTYQYYEESYFKTISVFDGGGTFFVNQPAAYRAAILDFLIGIPEDEWILLKLDKSRLITIDIDGKNLMRGWIKNLERDFLTSETTCELVTNLNQIVRIGS